MRCDILCQSDGARTVRCKSCQSLRSTLQSSSCHQKKNSHYHTGANSHTKYCSLTPSENDERMRNLHYSLRLARRQINRMKIKINKLLEGQALLLQEDDAANISSVVADMSPVVNEKFPKIHCRRCFGSSS